MLMFSSRLVKNSLPGSHTFKRVTPLPTMVIAKILLPRIYGH